jgi:hypothetical protein
LALSIPPDFTDGILTAAKLQQLSDAISQRAPLAARVTSTQNLATGTTTLASVNELVVVPSINGVYIADLTIVATLAAGTTEDIKIGLTFPTGATVAGGVLGGTAAGVTGSSSTDLAINATAGWSSGVSAIPIGLSTSPTLSKFWLILVMGSTAGNFQVQAAQNTGGANVVSVNVGSTLTLTQVA